MPSLPAEFSALKSRKWFVPTLLVAGALMFLGFRLGARDLWNPNEAIYGRAVVEMAENGEWLVPSLNGESFSEKPILYYWLSGLAHRLTGSINEVTLRLPSLGAGVLSVLFMFFLVRPYAGTKRAALASLLLMTQYQVWWASRSVQMDILVMTCTLATLLPLTRMLDHGLSRRWAWSLAGVAVGLGFSAKGPVAVVIPGLAFLGFVALDRRSWRQWLPGIHWGVLFGILLGAPWYLALAVSGNIEVIKEVLLRQNLSRFVEAWDHQQPWWYYAQYFWSDFFPWSWLIPAAAFLRPRAEAERSLHHWAWAWIATVFVFLSLSDSKRAPYMLPIAPAIAVLASSVVARVEERVERSATTVAAWIAMVLLAVVSIAGGVAIVLESARWSAESFAQYLPIVAVILAAMGLAIGFGFLLRSTRSYWATRGALVGVALIYILAAGWLLPSVNPRKSERFFMQQVDAIAGSDTELVSFQIPYRHAGFLYYGNRRVPNYDHLDDLEQKVCAHQSGAPWLIAQGPGLEALATEFASLPTLMERDIGSRRAGLITADALCSAISSNRRVE